VLRRCSSATRATTPAWFLQLLRRLMRLRSGILAGKSHQLHCAVSPGCAADQNPIRVAPVWCRPGGLDLAKQHGRTLANAVEMATSRRSAKYMARLRAAYEEVTLDYAKPRPPHP